jgi:sulfatase modifying factor 1
MFLAPIPSWAVVNIDYVTVGNPGNPNDTTGFGGVSYLYAIDKYEVTISQYAEFLNAAAASDPNGLYNPNMATDLKIAGISRSGSSGSYTYSVIGEGSRPITYVSFLDAMRFTNWLNNGQGSGSTETGAYTLSLGTSATRNPGATIWLPSENEWYKAGYYDPTKAGSSYWLFPTRSDTQPNSRKGSMTDSNSANYYYDDGIDNGYNGGFAVTNSRMFDPAQSYLTPVGAFTLASSYYGTFDQAGNVWEWNDTLIGPNRGIRAGEWATEYGALWKTNRGITNPLNEDYGLGFRVATVPEPHVFGLMMLGALILTFRRKKSF